MALTRSTGWVALNQWRASSPTRAPGRSPQRLSKASATWRWARARRVGPEVLVQGVLDEGVGEVVAPGGVGQLPHQRHGRRGVEDVEQVVLGVARWLGPGGRGRSRDR